MDDKFSEEVRIGMNDGDEIVLRSISADEPTDPEDKDDPRCYELEILDRYGSTTYICDITRSTARLISVFMEGHRR